MRHGLWQIVDYQIGTRLIIAAIDGAVGAPTVLNNIHGVGHVVQAFVTVTVTIAVTVAVAVAVAITFCANLDAVSVEL